MIPKIISHGEIGDQGYLTFDSRKVCFGFRSEFLDLEQNDVATGLTRLEHLLKTFPKGFAYRFYFQNRDAQIRGEFSRAKELTQVATKNPTVYLVAERSLGPNMLRQNPEEILKSSQALFPAEAYKGLGLTLEPMSVSELLGLSIQNYSTLKLHGASFFHQGEHVGLLAFTMPSSHPVSPWEISRVLEGLDATATFLLRIAKTDPIKSKLRLEHRVRSEEGQSSVKAQRQWVDTQDQLARMELDGEQTYHYEIQFLLKNSSYEVLQIQLSELRSQLSFLGEFELQSQGLPLSLIAFHLGGRPYVQLLETTRNLPVLIPLFLRWEATNPSMGSLALHRGSLSPLFFDPFDPKHSSYSGIIIGQTGRGKSVFTNQLLRALHFDPSNILILVDVKGSHKALVSSLGGQEIQIDIENPSGFDPFRLVTGNTTGVHVEILTQFVSVLLQREEEAKLPHEIRLQLEALIQSYLEERIPKPSLEDFIQRSTGNLEQRLELKRWSKSGLFGNVFNSRVTRHSSRLMYFNFSGILQASNTELSRAVMASVMAQFSFWLKEKESRQRLIFIADETPFFVKSCFESFRLLQKNVRSLNGSLFLIAQDSTDLVVEEDLSLLNNAAHKVLFTIDGDPSTYQERLGLSQFEMELLSAMKPGGVSYSSFLLKDPLRSRLAFLFLSPYEYWLSTTNPKDKKILEHLKGLFPEANDQILRETMARFREQGLLPAFEGTTR